CTQVNWLLDRNILVTPPPYQLSRALALIEHKLCSRSIDSVVEGVDVAVEGRAVHDIGMVAIAVNIRQPEQVGRVTLPGKVLVNPGDSFSAVPSPTLRVADNAQQEIAEQFLVVWIRHVATFVIDDDLRGPAKAGGNHRQAARHCFDDSQ